MGQKEKNGWNSSVPQFGGWDHKTGGAPDYSMVFSRVRDQRKQHKPDFNRPTLENDENRYKDSSSRRRRILGLFSCFKA